MFKRVFALVSRLICKLRGHDWSNYSRIEPEMSYLERHCIRCGEHEDDAPAMYWLIRDACDGFAEAARAEIARAESLRLDREILGRQRMNRFRWWLIRLLIGKAPIIANAKIEGMIVGSMYGDWPPVRVHNCLFTDARCPKCDKDALYSIKAAMRALAHQGARLSSGGNTNPEEFAEKMREISEGHAHDFEKDHGDADELMCDVLEALGYAEGVEIFRAMEKWYA